MRLRFEGLHLPREILALRSEHLPIDEYTGFFHGEQHWHERLLDVLINAAKLFDLAEFGPQLFVQLQRDVGILCRVRSRRFEIDLVECQLFGALAGYVFEANCLAPQVVTRCRVHVVASGDAVEYIGFEHRVKAHTRKFDTVAGEDVRVVLEVMADLWPLRVLQKSPESCENLVTRQLLGRTRIVVSNRNIGRLAGLNGERQADDFGLHVVQARRLGIHGNEICRRDGVEPAIECRPRQDCIVLTLHLLV